MPNSPPDPTDDAHARSGDQGAGAVSNRVSRYFREERQRTADGWDTPEDEDLPPLRTTVSVDTTKTIIAATSRRTSVRPFDQSLSRLRACCIYCFARPTHAYLGLSPGLDFETSC